MKSCQSLLQVLGCCCYLVQLTATLPFSFPDGHGRSKASARALSPAEPTSRQEAFEGRSSSSSSNGRYPFPDIYSRYQVHEDDVDPPGVHQKPTPYLPRPTPPSTGRITPPSPRYTTKSNRPNSAFNRLPPAKADEPIQAEPEDDYDDGDDDDVGEEGQPDKPVPVVPAYNPVAGGASGGSLLSPNSVNNLFYGINDKFGGLFGENRNKFKLKRRKPGQPCIPYSLLHKLKYGRDLQGNPVDPKTLLPNLNLILADLNYYAPNNNLYGDHASDTPAGGGGAVFNNHFYDAVGGYPCQGTSFGGGAGVGHKPFRPHRPHGGGPLGFFGQGGLFDWVPSADAVQSDEGVDGGGGGTGNRPTVVFNLNDAIDSVATNWRPGESFQKVMGVIADFITQVAGGAAAPVADVASDVRTINREFFSLFG